MSGLVLSLFPGIGLLDRAFEEEGFCVVRGPDLLWGGDIRRFHPPAGRFDGVIGGPPCRAFSRLVHMVRARGKRVADDLIPEFVRVVEEAAPGWFLMENVPAAPDPEPDGYAVGSTLLEDAAVGGETSRVRRFWFGSLYPTAPFAPETLALFREDAEQAVTRDPRAVPVALVKGGGKKGTLHKNSKRRTVADMLELQGFSRTMLDDCPMTDSGKRLVVGNGVPWYMGRAVARAVKRALDETEAA